MVNLLLPSWAEPEGRECLELLKMQSGTLQIHQQVVCRNLLPQTNSHCPFRDLLYITGGEKNSSQILAGRFSCIIRHYLPQNNIQISWAIENSLASGHSHVMCGWSCFLCILMRKWLRSFFSGLKGISTKVGTIALWFPEVTWHWRVLLSVRQPH